MTERVQPVLLAGIVLGGLGLLVIIFGSVWLLTESDNPASAPLPTDIVRLQETQTPVPTAVPRTAQASETLPATWTPLPTQLPGTVQHRTATATGTDQPSLTPLPTKTDTSTPTLTPTPTATFTPTITLSPTASLTPDYSPTPTVTLIAGAPRPAPLLATEHEIINVLLIGSDHRVGQHDFRTDVLVVVSINRTTKTVNMLSLPRDLYVYIPNYGYDRINTAALWGTLRNYPGGGITLLKDTIRYNLGIPIDAYAMVNFRGFEAIVDTLDGVDLVVDCALSDYRLKSPELNPNVRGNWEEVTLDVGLQRLDGATALWYVRSRATTSDFDRNRRHQMMLRALWQRFLDDNQWENIPELWAASQDIIETDLALNQIIDLVPVGLQIKTHLIESHFIGVNEVVNYTTPGGAKVLRMRTGAIASTLQKFYTPPTQNRIYQEGPAIAIQNHSGIEGLEYVAMERLGWSGFAPMRETTLPENRDFTLSDTVIYDYTGNDKGGNLRTLTRLLGISSTAIIVEPDPGRTVDYKIVLGSDYLNHSCTYQPYGNYDEVD